ncbi:ATP-dependent exoDNAse (exonuclease V) beta subunit (contains helicase and exonuclease domains) [Mariprofundus aestuarium]|uniref:DNA 3'-5' helicase n=1 Tax=Mariprofundus aestuarium TaxID=1921086 RepID=A0A2K8L1Z0_MARES|nr:UvrD-helicase domain-containing protein [Mariprofundus aestuarium]ATX79851.1 ATP-dependent exoDNAse (exonuclease V) beta subunit (contains helicase and exonuclease domains) [Mariprofundus aestuarium]
MSEQARLKARNPQLSSLVQAPAGSGKTELLTQRILALLALVDEPEEILALTFTRKAAAEMRSRVIEALSMARPDAAQAHKMETWELAQAALKRSEERGWHISEHAGRFRLMTLDSLTHSLASQLPLLSGLGEMPRPGDYLYPAYRQAAETALNQLLRSDTEAAELLLLHLDHQAVVLIDLVADMLAKREQWLEIVISHARDMDGLRAMLESGLGDIMEEPLRLCAELIPIGIREALPGLLAFAGEQRGEPQLQALNGWPDAELNQLQQWQLIAGELLTKDGLRKPGGINARRGFPAGKEHADQKLKFQEILSQLAEIRGLEVEMLALQKLPAEPGYSEQQWLLMQALFSLLILSAGQLQQGFAQNGEADFTEVALRALKALEGEQGTPSDLLLKLDYRIHHILVDEFQDTSLLQMRLLQNLTAGWQAGDGRHRTLFMVGDPMQSIYRFRKAEVGLFLQAAANQVGLPVVEPLQLERNFRSSPTIVDWVNRAFAAIFPDQQDTVRGAVAHAPATPALNHAGIIQLHIQQLGRDDLQEAEAVVELVRRERDITKADGRPQSIALLARSRKHLHAIMPALQEAGIPFRATKLLPLHTRPEIRLLRALLRALLHPADRESWAALLRSNYCGLNTVDLFALLGASEKPVWQLINDEPLLALMEHGAAERVVALQRALAPCMEQAGRVPVRQLLESAWHRLAMFELLDQSGCRNVDVALDLIASLDEGGRIDLSLFDERLEKLYAAPDSSPEAAQVELMTMHGAKGLQWDVVILPGLGKRGNSSDSPLLAYTDVPVHGEVHPLLAVRAATRGGDALFSLVNGVEKSKYDYELARLLYVACTRAETSLHMLGYVSETNGSAMSGSLLNLLIPGGIEGGCFGAELVDLVSQAGLHAVPQLPLQRIRQLPVARFIEKQEGESEAEYLWAGPEAAPVGNAVHAALQHIGDVGVERWGADQKIMGQLRTRRILLAEGLSGAMLQQAEKRAENALDRTLNSETGRWILSGNHESAHCEWALSTQSAGFVSHHIIDRSFIDEKGVRWIIDYKTAAHEGSDLEGFLAEEAKRHESQLSRYALILQSLEPSREIRTALYFPMLDVLKEVCRDA